MIAVWRAAARAGSPLRALRHFSASQRECARKLSRAIKMPLMRRATLIVLWHVFLSQHFSCFDFCRARPLPAHKRAHIRMSAPSRGSRRTSKLKRKGQKEWKQNACTIPCRRPRPSLCKESGAGHLSAHAAKTALQLRTAHYLPPSKNAARERSLRDENEKYITSDRVFARRGGAAGVEAKCLHDSVQAFAAVALRRRWCAGRDLNPHERTAH